MERKTSNKKDPILCRGDYQTESEAIEQLGRLAAMYTNLNQWKDRAAKIRQQILVGAKLYPLPERTPINAVVLNKREYVGYSVESAAFEARPGFFVYGNLYRPSAAKGPRPAILCPHGHAHGPAGGLSARNLSHIFDTCKGDLQNVL